MIAIFVLNEQDFIETGSHLIDTSNAEEVSSIHKAEGPDAFTSQVPSLLLSVILNLGGAIACLCCTL